VKRVQLDLRGEVCPYTFVRTKLALEELADGDELVLILDHRPAFTNIPQALAEDGYPVLAIERRAEDRECVITTRRQTAPPT
jgi:tRNA 2-thiouridine synthesizing protein A